MKNLTEDEEDEPTTIVGELALSYLQDEDGSAGAGQDAYVVYMGDGTVEAGWPDIGGWVSWTNMYVFPPLLSSYLLFFESLTKRWRGNFICLVELVVF